MARITVNRFPIENVDAEIVQLFGNSYGGRVQTGIQVTASGTNSVNAMMNVTILETGNGGSYYGNYVIMKDNNSTTCFLYGNLYQISVSQGQVVNAHSEIGKIGVSVGYFTLEIQNVDPNVGWYWSNNTFYYIDPSLWIPIASPSTGDTIYYGYNPPTPPVPPTPSNPRRTNFPWILYANKIRNRY